MDKKKHSSSYLLFFEFFHSNFYLQIQDGPFTFVLILFIDTHDSSRADT